MPEVAKKVVIDRKRKKLFIEGVEFSWTMDQSGPHVERLPDDDSIGLVTIPICADEVEVIPECEGCDRLDQLGVSYHVVANGVGEHLRHVPDRHAAEDQLRRAEAAVAIARERLATVSGPGDRDDV